jgi:DNA-binding IclR family transcriptional regulator
MNENLRTFHPGTPSSTTSGREAGVVRVLARGLAILKTLASTNLRLSNQQIADAAGLPRPTVSRITANLVRLGYLDYFDRDGTYCLAKSVLALGFAAHANLEVQIIMRSFMQQLADSADAMVVLATRDGMTMVCHEVCHGNNILSLRVNAGSRLSLPRSAMGRALIGAMPEPERADLLKIVRSDLGVEWSGFQNVVTDAIEQMRNRGFYVSIGTLEQGVNGIGTVIAQNGMPVTHTLGLAGPAFRFPRARLESELGPALLEIASRACQHLAGVSKQD